MLTDADEAMSCLSRPAVCLCIRVVLPLKQISFILEAVYLLLYNQRLWVRSWPIHSKPGQGHKCASKWICKKWDPSKWRKWRSGRTETRLSTLTAGSIHFRESPLTLHILYHKQLLWINRVFFLVFFPPEHNTIWCWHEYWELVAKYLILRNDIKSINAWEHEEEESDITKNLQVFRHHKWGYMNIKQENIWFFLGFYQETMKWKHFFQSN